MVSLQSYAATLPCIGLSTSQGLQKDSILAVVKLQELQHLSQTWRPAFQLGNSSASPLLGCDVWMIQLDEVLDLLLQEFHVAMHLPSTSKQNTHLTSPGRRVAKAFSLLMILMALTCLAALFSTPTQEIYRTCVYDIIKLLYYCGCIIMNKIFLYSL